MRASAEKNHLNGGQSTRWVRWARRPGRRRGLPGWAGALALLAFGLRSLVPIGFEPAPGTLSIVLCQEGFPAQDFSQGKAAHDGRGSGSAGGAHCAFCNGTSPAPAYTLADIARGVPPAIGVVSVSESALDSIRPAHTPQARAPPAIA